MGDVIDGEMHFNEVGALILEVWTGLPERFPSVVVGSFVVMPNHVHGIAMLGMVAMADDGANLPGRACPAPTGVAEPESGVIVPSNPVGAELAVPGSDTAASTDLHHALNRPTSSRPVTLGAVIGAFKSLSAIGIYRLLDRAGAPFWQRNYYEHIVRTDAALERIRVYIARNPANWATDEENPARLR